LEGRAEAGRIGVSTGAEKGTIVTTGGNLPRT
jgi:hypothetical protein